MDSFGIGSITIIDGKAWTVESIGGASGNVARALGDDGRQAIYFDAREPKYLGAGLFGLPGRIEPGVNPSADVVASVATADAAVNAPG
jgi:hypothetical protein